MSKPVKSMMIDSYRDLFAEVEGAVLVDIRGIDANENNTLRSELARKQIRITVIRNLLARRAFRDMPLEPLGELLEGPSALVYGADSVVEVTRELIGWTRKLKKLELKGAVMEGQVFGPDQMERLSKYPTREEAQAQVIQVVLGPAGQVIGAATSAGANIAGILDALVEKLEKGEAVEAAA